MALDNFSSVGPPVVGGFLAGVLIGYALKKVVKLVGVAVGLFFAGLAYLQYQQLVNINWNKLQVLSQNTISTLTNAATQNPGFNSSSYHAVESLGIPLTWSMSMGFAIGFMKG